MASNFQMGQKPRRGASRFECIIKPSGTRHNQTIKRAAVQRTRHDLSLSCRQAVSDEAKATLAYLGEMWRVIANVAEIVEKNQSHQPLGDDPLHFVVGVMRSRVL